MIKNKDYWGGELYFDNNRSSISKSGTTYICIGVDIFANKESVSLCGINMKNGTRGKLTIPKQDVQELIEILKATL